MTTKREAMKTLVSFLFFISLVCCSGSHVIWPRHIEKAEEACLNNGGIHYMRNSDISYDLKGEPQAIVGEVTCNNGGRFNLHEAISKDKP